MDWPPPSEIVVAGQRVRYRSAGAGPPVVLLHGLAASSRWWRETARALAADRTVLVLDLPRRLSVADTPAFVLAWLDAVGLARVDLVGHSLGGLHAARVAAISPERVRRLVLVAPAGVPAHAGVGGHVAPLARSLWRASPGLFVLVAGDALRAGPIRVAARARELVAYDVTAELNAIAAPTLLVWGEGDALVPHSLARDWQREIPNALLELLPRARHVPML